MLGGIIPNLIRSRDFTFTQFRILPVHMYYTINRHHPHRLAFHFANNTLWPANSKLILQPPLWHTIDSSNIYKLIRYHKNNVIQYVG